MKTLSIVLDDAVEKALLWDIADLEVWANNAVSVKAGQCTDSICRLALEDTTHTILSLKNKQELRDYLTEQGIILTSINQLPEYVKTEIVKRADIKSAATRQAEYEEEIKKRSK